MQPSINSQRLFDGVVLRMEWEKHEVLNIHLSGSLLRRAHELSGLTEDGIIEGVEQQLRNTFS